MKEKSSRRLFSLAIAGAALALLVIVGARYFHGAHAHEHHGDDGEAALVLNEGRRWETDATLREGMERIRDLAASMRRVLSGQRLDPTQAAAVAQGVRDEISRMIALCKLAPKADAALHVLISDMLKGADGLARPETAVESLALMRHALEQYPRYFEHPGWKP